MKRLHIFTLALVCILVNTNKTYGQTAPLDTSKAIFNNQDALNAQLDKFGLKTLEFSEGANCLRYGQPLLKKGSGTPAFEEDLNPVKRTINEGYTEKKDSINGDINIYWIHGLNGTTESLRVPAQATQFGAPGFPARKANSVRGIASSSSHALQYYSEDGGITPATGDLNNVNKVLVPTAARTKYDFIIAHSQGGIAAREWLRNMEQKPNMYEKFAHGLVTFGTPHGGAQVINNTRPDMGNKIPDFMREACVSIVTAEVEDALKNDLFTRMVVSQNMKNKLVQTGCGVISETIIPLALDNYFKRTTLDYFVGAPFLNGYADASGQHVEGLSEYTQKVPVVQFYGQEDQPILWKFLSSTQGIGHDKLDNTEMIFGYDQDDQLENKVSNLINTYEAKYLSQMNIIKNLKNSISSRSLGLRIMFPIFYVLTKDKIDAAQVKADAFIRAKLWLTNANDYYLTDLIGGREEKQVKSHCIVLEQVMCRDASKNPAASGLPPVMVTNSYNAPMDPTGIQCSILPINVKYSNYSFPGLDGTTWTGNCVGSQAANFVWKNIGTYKHNDGVVLAESASADIKVSSIVNPNNSYVKVKMLKTNHEQMKNSKVTSMALFELYSGTYGRFFKVDVR
ncbi:MAG: hypothetical protein SGJ00_08580 [bacterium]|nr:hypothetical protein [bacterium]